jgi:hypothetical protein
MDEPGAWVDGHRGAVRGRGLLSPVSCSCGHPFAAQPSVQGACLVLVHHLQSVVRDGARVVRGDDDGLAGVREPRRPVPSLGSGTVELDIA